MPEMYPKQNVSVRASRLEIFKNTGSLKNIASIAWTLALVFLFARYCAGGIQRVYAFNDYVGAGRHWIQGECLYGNWRGFIYSPVIAAFFAPLSILPAVVAYLFWLIINASVFLSGLTEGSVAKICFGRKNSDPAKICRA